MSYDSPFNPRIIPADEAPLADDGSLQLPADLADLAAQLSDDANYLATLYPAQPAAHVELPATPPRHRFLGLLGFGLLAVVSLSGWWIWSGGPSREKTTIATLTIVEPTASPVAMNAVNEESILSFPVSLEQPNAEGIPLYEYSGPELEGVYDLLAEAPQVEISF